MKTGRLGPLRHSAGAKRTELNTPPESQDSKSPAPESDFYERYGIARMPAYDVHCTREDHEALKQSVEYFAKHTEYCGYQDGFIYGNHDCGSTLLMPSDAPLPEELRRGNLPERMKELETALDNVREELTAARRRPAK
jgi:hypothetical protein